MGFLFLGGVWKPLYWLAVTARRSGISLPGLVPVVICGWYDVLMLSHATIPFWADQFVDLAGFNMVSVVEAVVWAEAVTPSHPSKRPLVHVASADGLFHQDAGPKLSEAASRLWELIEACPQIDWELAVCSADGMLINMVPAHWICQENEMSNVQVTFPPNVRLVVPYVNPGSADQARRISDTVDLTSLALDLQPGVPLDSMVELTRIYGYCDTTDTVSAERSGWGYILDAWARMERVKTVAGVRPPGVAPEIVRLLRLDGTV